MAQARALVVDDDWTIRDVLTGILNSEGCEVDSAADGEEGIALINSKSYQLILTDLRMPKKDGIEILKHLKKINSQALCIVLTGYGTIESAIEALKHGAYDYVTKPFHVDEIKMLVRKAIEYRNLQNENIQLKRQLKSSNRFENIIGTSTQMQDLFNLIRMIADSDSTALITGESGTGKELVARAIHYNGPRYNCPLVTVNCGAIPEDLLESELFGHVKGSFTGAIMNRIGRFQYADGGTIFLDEIGDMIPKLQVKVLRVLQEQEFDPVGSTETIKVNVRVIAATNKNLEKLVQERKFREDLFYRLNVIPVFIPPLRERKDDIPLLIQHFIEKFNKSKKRQIERYSDEVIEILKEYPWPGNVRELENLIERIAILKGEGSVEVADLPEKFIVNKRPSTVMNVTISDKGINFKDAVEEFEMRLISQALAKSNNIKSKAAKVLNIKRTTLIEKMKKLKLEA